MAAAPVRARTPESSLDAFPPCPRSTLRVAAFVGALLAALVLTSATATARRPAPPAGSAVLAPGQLPHVCAQGDERYGADGYRSIFGVYYDAASRQWLSAPLCYPRWGFLQASGPRLVRAGEPVTVTATPTDGSNSATYAPQTQTIAWRFPGTRRAGCGNADLSCTFVPVAEPKAVWQWFEVQVSMPRTFFINSSGSNCAGQPVCAGVTTHAWSWIGVRPRDDGAMLTGRVTDADGDGVEDVRIRAAGPATVSTTTSANGTYELRLPRAGLYRVTASDGSGVFSPRVATVQARAGGRARQSIRLVGCRRPEASAAASGSAPQARAAANCGVTLSGTVRQRQCEEPGGACRPVIRPAANRAVTLVAGGRTFETETDRDGRYAFSKVRRGRFTIRIPGGTNAAQPRSRSGNAQRDIGGLDFQLCRPVEPYQGPRGCRLVRVAGEVVGIDGRPYPTLGVETDDDAGRTRAAGRFSLWATPSSPVITVTQGLRAAQRFRVRAPEDVNGVRIQVRPRAYLNRSTEREVSVQLYFLPLAETAFVLRLRRSEPVANRICRYQQTADISGSRTDVYVLRPRGFSTFCPGRYTLEVRADSEAETLYDTLAFEIP